MFESFVNSERCKTYPIALLPPLSLRALLIQKDVKLFQLVNTYTIGLRALLIQKDVKQMQAVKVAQRCLRALLIQKDVKPKRQYYLFQ